MDTVTLTLRQCPAYRHWYIRGERALGLPYRGIRAAASALLVAAAAGTGGMAGMTSALASDPAMVSLTGSVVDGDGTPLPGVHVVISEELRPDGGSGGFQVITGSDGSFAVDVYSWGTADAPATLTFATSPDEEIEIDDQSCTRTWTVDLSDERQLALGDGPPEPLTLAATTRLVGEVCGTTGTPRPSRHVPTPPPTDVAIGPAIDSPSDRHGPALIAGFALGLLLAAALLPLLSTRRRS